MLEPGQTADDLPGCAVLIASGINPSISFVCQPGRLAAQSVLLAASLRVEHPDLRLVAALPGELSDAAAHALGVLDVATATIANPLAADYPIGNKLAALAAGDAGGLRVFLDSDMLCLRALDWSVLESHDLAAKPADLATFGDEAMWQLLYARFGLPAPAGRVVATVEGRLMFPYFNAGMLATTQAKMLSTVWVDVCRAIDGMADIQPRRPWLDQVGLPIAAARLALSTRALGEDWNHPAHVKPLTGAPALVHYHVPRVVARDPALLARVGDLIARWPEVNDVVRGDEAWAPVVQAVARPARSRTARGLAPGVGRDLVVTGIPRSGTSYLCRLLDGLDNMAVINEPMELFEGLCWSPDPWIVPLLHADLRARIDAGEAVENKLDAQGAITEDTAMRDDRVAYRPALHDADWVLATKNTLAYLARLDGILRVFPTARVVACVRHPLDTIASWKSTFAHLAAGDPRALPVGGLADPFLPSHLRDALTSIAALADPAVRRAAWWRLLASEIVARSGRIAIVRYEDLVANPGATLRRALGPLADRAGASASEPPPSAIRSGRREALDAADWDAAAMLCAGVAARFGYDVTRHRRRRGDAAVASPAASAAAAAPLRPAATSPRKRGEGSIDRPAATPDQERFGGALFPRKRGEESLDGPAGAAPLRPSATPDQERFGGRLSPRKRGEESLDGPVGAAPLRPSATSPRTRGEESPAGSVVSSLAKNSPPPRAGEGQGGGHAREEHRDDDRGEQRHGMVGRPDLWRMKRAFQIDFLRRQGLQPSHTVLDIGCGSLRGGAALIAFLDAGRYTGIDVREEVLVEARQELLREALQDKAPELVLVGDMATLDLRRHFDVAWAFSVLFHLSDPILADCFAMVARHLAPDAVFFANVIAAEGPPGEWQGFPVVPRLLDAYRELGRRHGLHSEVLGTLGELGHHSGDASQDTQPMLAFSRNPAGRLH